MSFWKAGIGGMIGFSIGGPIGGILGAIIGSKLSGKDQVEASTKQRNQAAFFTALFACFAKIAKADGKVSPVEVEKLSEIAGYMRISTADFNSIKAMFVAQTDSAYTILEVSKTSTDAEIKKAYRDLVKKHHPDRVRNLGPAAEKAAKEKFQRIQEAYEAIKNERGF